MSWCTYTDPEIAQVGLNEDEADNQGMAIDVYRVEFSDIDRALTDGEEEGFLKLLTRKGTGRIVGATIAGAHAGEMISEVSVAMAGRVGLGNLAQVIHPYPTRADAVRRAGNLYLRNRLTPRIQRLLKGWLKWRRGA